MVLSPKMSFGGDYCCLYMTQLPYEEDVRAGLMQFDAFTTEKVTREETKAVDVRRMMK